MLKNIILIVIIGLQVNAFAQTKIIAHRGAWKNTKVPQNSIASLKGAIEQKTWGAEFDVHITKDDVLVVAHDDDFNGKLIAKTTYDELLKSKLPNGEKIPTAEEYLKEGLKQKETKLIYELKTSPVSKERTLKAVELSLELVKKLKAEHLVEFIAFDYDACLHFRKLDESILIHYLSSDKSPKEIHEAKLSGIDYYSKVFLKKPEWIKEAKELGLITNVWTVNKEKDMQFFIDHQIDFISTDEPEKLKTLLLNK